MKKAEAVAMVERGIKFLQGCKDDRARIPDLLSAMFESPDSAREVIHKVSHGIAEVGTDDWEKALHAGLEVLNELDDQDALPALVGLLSYFNFSLGSDQFISDHREELNGLVVRAAAKMAEEVLNQIFEGQNLGTVKLDVAALDNSDNVIAFDQEGREVAIPRSFLKKLGGE